ncbi:MAG: 50S ribosomal protein L10 [Patescibacteria group bacterium]|jgi:large subunit ribosomal protein L10
MAKTREQKKEIVARLAEKMSRMKAAAFSSISGYTMEQANALREKAAEKNVDIFIAKKTLLSHAAKEAGFEVDPQSFEGSILTAVAYDDEVSAAKMLKEFMKVNENFKLVGGILEGKAISKEMVNQLAMLPSKKELLAKMVGSLNAPISGFVNVLAGNLRGLVSVLGAIKDKKTS